ncbi:MAG TPA: N-acetylglucosamine-6-phosphate deacetylase, partial [Candidatus Binataceae bacterium]|nr:N-acetylglucosamine-6-phosphate deacetylase [Candidatus Binataceae bacterium]
GFVDLQVNGSHGIDVMSTSADGILQISDQLAREGTSAWLPTAVTSPIEQIEKAHRAIGEAIARQQYDPATGARVARILGMHLEGPFISPMRLGAHPKLHLEPRGEAFERVMALEHLKLVTLAPELPGALDAIKRLTSRGVVVSIGHTNATFEEASAGIAAGARMFTHLFNAMRPLNHRDPGVVAAALTGELAMPAVIPDGVHLTPEILRLIYMTRTSRRMFMTTDKVSLAGTSTGIAMPVGREQARIVDGAARLPDGTLAGATISMLEGARVMQKIGAGIGDLAMMAARNPADLLGETQRGRLQPGAVSDIIVLDETLRLKAVFLAGRELS